MDNWEEIQHRAENAPPGLELAVIGTGENRFLAYLEPELLDMNEFRRTITERFLEETVGDVDDWQPLGILNTPHAPAPPPPPPSCEEEGWGQFRALTSAMFGAMLEEWDRGMVADREVQNSRARRFWRAQRRLTLTDLMDILGVRHGTALEALGLL